jgi:hypothetical protein
LLRSNIGDVLRERPPVTRVILGGVLPLAIPGLQYFVALLTRDLDGLDAIVETAMVAFSSHQLEIRNVAGNLN